MGSIFQIFYDHFFDLKFIAISLMIFTGLFIVFWVYSICKGKLVTVVKFAPSIMTATGLIGTFVGLTIGLQDFNPSDSKSMDFLVAHLKVVFIL